MLKTIAAKLERRRKNRATSDLCKLAAAHLEAGERDQAEACCRRALAIDDDANDAHKLLAKIALPGESYLEILGKLHVSLQPRNYIEIGVDSGASIILAGPNTRAFGVDPRPELKHKLPATTKLFKQKSDDFFASQRLKTELGDQRIDLAFIDGMHLFEYALRDFINIEKHCSPRATVLVHDCYPLDEITARRERATRFWSGDIWRLIVTLKRYRPDLQVHTIAAQPTGLGFIRNLDPSSTVLVDKYEEIVASMLALPYESLGADKDGALNRISNDWPAIAAMSLPQTHAAMVAS